MTWTVSEDTTSLEDWVGAWTFNLTDTEHVEKGSSLVVREENGELIVELLQPTQQNLGPGKADFTAANGLLSVHFPVPLGSVTEPPDEMLCVFSRIVVSDGNNTECKVTALTLKDDPQTVGVMGGEGGGD